MTTQQIIQKLLMIKQVTLEFTEETPNSEVRIKPVKDALQEAIDRLYELDARCETLGRNLALAVKELVEKETAARN